jgi:hypothetical protein
MTWSLRLILLIRFLFSWCLGDTEPESGRCKE